MISDRKIRKKLNSELEKIPTKSFETFCADNNIVVENKAKPTKKSFDWKKVVFPLAAAAVLCVVLPVTLTRHDGGGGADLPSTGKQYNVGREVTKPVDFAELERDPDLVLYDTEYERQKKYSAMLYSEDDGILLAYVVKSVIYGGQIDGTLYPPYQFDFLARCYDGYAETYSLVLDWYEQNGMNYTFDGVDYYYGVVSGADGESAVICYENGKYDYFVRLRLLNVGSSMTDKSVENFISLAFGDANEEAVQ